MITYKQKQTVTYLAFENLLVSLGSIAAIAAYHDIGCIVHMNNV